MSKDLSHRLVQGDIGLQPFLFHSFDLCIIYTVSVDCKSLNRLIVNRLIVIGLSVNIHYYIYHINKVVKLSQYVATGKTRAHKNRLTLVH